MVRRAHHDTLLIFNHEEHEVHEGVYEEILSFLRVLRAFPPIALAFQQPS